MLLKTYIKRNKLTNQEAANLLGVSLKTVYNFLTAGDTIKEVSGYYAITRVTIKILPKDKK